MTAILYTPSLGYGWIYEDLNDPQTFFRPIADVLATWTWRPSRGLTQLTFALTEHEFPQHAWAYHAGNVGLHLLNGGLLYGLATTLLPPWAAVVALGVFLLHPVQVESVAYVANRPELLATTALLVGLWAVTARRWWLVLLAGYLACLAKETGVLALPIGALFAVWRWGAIPAPIMTLITGVCALASVVLLASYSFAFESTYALTQLAAFTRLLLLVIWPVGLSIDHDWAFSALTLIATAGLWAWLAVRASQAPRSFFALAFGTCAIVVAPRMLVPLLEGLHEHHLLIPMIPISLLIGACWGTRKERYGVSASPA